MRAFLVISAVLLPVISALSIPVVNPEECQDGYETISNTHVIGATRYPMVNTLEECKALCNQQADCLAIDWNFNDVPFYDTRCWLHYKLEGLEVISNRVVHHIKKCIGPEPMCNMMYDHTPAHSAVNTTLIPGATNVEQCRDACNEDLMCRGFDVTTEGEFRCWLRKWGEENIEPRDDVDHYTRLPCMEIACTSSFDRLVNQRVRYGHGFIQHTTVEACTAECLSDDNCISFDFVTDDTPWRDTYCWIHYDVIEVVPTPGVDHYSKQGLACTLPAVIG